MLCLTSLAGFGLEKAGVPSCKSDGPSSLKTYNWKGIWKPIAAIVAGTVLAVGSLALFGVLASLTFGATIPFTLHFAIGAAVESAELIGWGGLDLWSRRAQNSNEDPAAVDLDDEPVISGDMDSELSKAFLAKGVNVDMNLVGFQRFYKALSAHNRHKITSPIPEGLSADALNVLISFLKSSISEQMIEDADEWVALSENTIGQLKATKVRQLLISGGMTITHIKLVGRAYLDWDVHSRGQGKYTIFSDTNCEAIEKGEPGTLTRIFREDPKILTRAGVDVTIEEFESAMRGQQQRHSIRRYTLFLSEILNLDEILKRKVNSDNQLSGGDSLNDGVPAGTEPVLPEPQLPSS